MKNLKSLFLVCLLFNFILAADIPELTGHAIKDSLINEYKTKNNKQPDYNVSILDILNSSNLYSTMTDNEINDPDKGILKKLIAVIDELEINGSAIVTLKLQGKFYPEGTFKYDYQAEAQRQRFIDTLIPIIEDTMLDEQEMLDSIHIYDSVPYFTIKVDSNNIWKLLDSKGIVDIELVELEEIKLAQSSPLIGATNAWSGGADGSGQTVAILDTGVRKTHQFLTGKVVSEACYSNAGGFGSGSSLCPGGVTASTASGSGVNCNTSYSACHHGTHVAGIAAGKGNSFSGVAKEASIIAIQVFTNIGGKILSYTYDQQRALERVYALRNTYNIAAANMSLGGGRYTSYCNSNSRKAIIDNLLSVGIATVISSGNDGYTNAVGAPGCIQSAITVGATSDGGWGRTVDSVDYYSNSASMVDLLAPGSAIYSSLAGSNSQYSTYQGTSMAAPQVTGAFAVLKSANNSISVNDMLSILQSTGKSVKDSKNNITKKRINVNAAVAQLGSADVTVSISPAGANSDGAKWRLEGTNTWRNSGDTISGVLLGTHTIYGQTITNSDDTKVWQTPTLSITISSDGDNKSENLVYSETEKSGFVTDLDGDGKSDLYWRNRYNGEMLIYLMDGADIKLMKFVNLNGTRLKVPVGNWQVEAISDLDGDGKSDLYWRNKQTGQMLIYLMDGADIKLMKYVNLDGTRLQVPVGNWQVEDISDLDGDGKSDIYWRNKHNGQMLIYLMDGADIKLMKYVNLNGTRLQVPVGSWQVEAISDLDGDGKSDIYWRNKQTGQMLIYLMDGADIKLMKYVNLDGTRLQVPVGNWQVEDISDLDGDGKSDIYWRNKHNGQMLIYLMDGADIKLMKYVNLNGTRLQVPVGNWQVETITDLDGDGKSDIYWRNKYNGQMLIYLMDGADIKLMKFVNLDGTRLSVSTGSWNIENK